MELRELVHTYNLSAKEAEASLSYVCSENQKEEGRCSSVGRGWLSIPKTPGSIPALSKQVMAGSAFKLSM